MVLPSINGSVTSIGVADTLHRSKTSASSLSSVQTTRSLPAGIVVHALAEPMKLVFEPSMSVRFLIWKEAAFDGPLVIGENVAYPSASPQVVPPPGSL
jgi:hypothetical protein